MLDDVDENAEPTRRGYLKYDGALFGGEALAGCAGRSGDGATMTATETTTATEAEAEATETATETAESGYAAELSPVRTVMLDEPPTNVLTHFPWFPDMASAPGQGDTVNNLWRDGIAAGLEYFTTGFGGFEIEWADTAGECGFTKERLYELDSDLHLVDPAWVTTQDNWNQSGIDEVADNVGPWFGNYYSNFNAAPPEGWADGHEYCDLWELFEHVASLYGEREHYEALQPARDDQLTTVEDGLLPESERPTAVCLSISTDLSSIYLLCLNAPGYWNAHTRPLDAVDAFGDEEFTGSSQEVDVEALLGVNPGAILTLWAVTETLDFNGLKQNLRDDPVGRELAAVRNDRVYPQGTRWQGPLMNLFQTEMMAKQFYPERFGAQPIYKDGDDYPGFGADEQLFDRAWVEELVVGGSL